ncbi:MAG: hypothetical protein ACFFDK_12800 [Promethearchaeota archaeon]
MILKILNLFQEGRDFPPLDYPGTNILNQIPGYGSTFFFIILIIIIWFASGIFMAYLVKKDLQKREVSGISYIILTLLMNIVGLSIYLLVRYNEMCALEENEEACLLEDDTQYYEQN